MYKVIKDTREQRGWDFPASPYCEGTIIGTLHTGDYTLRGYENVFVIERKGCIVEFAKNIVQNRFEDELIRLEEFRYPFAICEFDLADIINFPNGSGLPYKAREKMRINPYFILKRFIELQIKYKTKFILAGKLYGKELASSIFKRVIESNG